VDQPSLVQGLHRAGHLLEQPEGRLQGERPAREPRPQALARQTLHGQVRSPVRQLSEAEDAYHPRVVDLGQQAGLLQEPAALSGVGEQLLAQHLERHLPVPPARGVDGASASGAEHAL